LPGYGITQNASCDATLTLAREDPSSANAACSQTLILRSTDLLPFTTRGETDMHRVMVSCRDGRGVMLAQLRTNPRREIQVSMAAESKGKC
jgi:hypothetical protein